MTDEFKIERASDKSGWYVMRKRSTAAGMGYWLVLITFPTKARCKEWLSDYRQQLGKLSQQGETK